MTMKLIRHGTKRAGFTDWPDYDNIPGKGEPLIARCAYQDNTWETGPPPRTYNTSKTITGAKVAEKIRDLRLRRSLTGKTSLPRLTKKTNPKQIEAEQVDFEEEVAKFKQNIASDIQQLRQQAYKEPAWIKKIMSQEQKATKNKPRPSASSSSSNWEQPISDSQAMELSRYLLTEAEEHEFLASQEDNQTAQDDIIVTQESEEAPLSCETHGEVGRHYTHTELWHKDPITDTWFYGPQFPYATQVDNDPEWETWLAAVTTSPPHDYYYLETI